MGQSSFSELQERPGAPTADAESSASPDEAAARPAVETGSPVGDVFRRLASLAAREPWQAFVPDGPPLLSAVMEVGRALGVRIQPPPAPDGLRKLSDPLEELVRASRIRKRRVLLRDSWWKKDCGPLLGYTLEGNHPVALIPISATRYEMFDPSQRTRLRVDGRIAATLSPVADMLYRPLPESQRGPAGILQFGFKGHFKDLLQVPLWGIAAALLGMLVPLATVVLIDRVIPQGDRALLVQIGLCLLVVIAGKTLFDLAQGFAILRLETYSTSSIQAAVWDRLLNLKLTFFREYSAGDLQVRAAAASTIHQLLSATTLRILFAGVISLLNLLLMFYLSVRLSVVASALALFMFAVAVSSGIRIFRRLRSMQAMMGKNFGLAVQLINGVSRIRVSGAEERAFAYWGKKYGEQQRLSMEIQRIEDNLKVFNQTLLILVSALILYLAIQLGRGGPAGAGSLTAGTLLAFYAALGIFLGGVTALSNTLIEVLSVLNLWERAKPILEAETEVDERKTHPRSLSGRVALEQVTFRYRNEGPLTLDQVSIHAEPGEFIALVGPSGGGKSTILRLLLGFERAHSGTVAYDGQNLSGLDIHAVRRQLGVVLQDGKILAASIFENIAGGTLIDLDEAWEAARAAGWAQDIESMPMGMHTYISEGGTNLSGGQRQRLLIARALVSKPKILLFDEATSSLDNRTQAIVSESLDRLQVTRIVVAHRLSTVRQARRIYVIEAGRVVQQGTFDELAREEGLFARIMARQTI